MSTVDESAAAMYEKGWKASQEFERTQKSESEKFFAHLNNGEVELVPQYGADEKVHYITVRILRKAGEWKC